MARSEGWVYPHFSDELTEAEYSGPFQAHGLGSCVVDSSPCLSAMRLQL